MSLLSIIEMCGGNFLASLAPNLSEPQRQGLEASPKSDERGICLSDFYQWSYDEHDQDS